MNRLQNKEKKHEKQKTKIQLATLCYSSKSETDNKVTAVQANVNKIGNYTAYANSADGTDGFTTVYPNLNLGDNTKTFVGTEVEGSNLRGSIRIEPATQKTQDGDINYLTFKPTRDGFDWFRFFLIPDTATPNVTKVTVKPNTKYTFSVWLKGTGQHTIYAYQNWTAPNTPWVLQINLTSEWKIYTFTVTSSNVIPDRNVQFFIRSKNGTEINLKYPKVEEGSIATPYMPSGKELTSNDIPKYVGYSVRQSENPEDFSWQPYSGLNSYNITKATTAIEQNSKEIALKANKLEVDTLSGRVLTAEGSISTMAGQIVLKANQADVNTTNGKVSSLESSFTIQSDQISALNTKTDGTNTSLSQFKQDYDGFKSTVYSKTQTDTKISTVQANVDKLGTNIAYAWSQDGNDRFTRVKPNENIITQSPSGESLTSTTTNNTDFFYLFKISQNYQKLSNWTTLNEVFTIGFSWESSTDLPDGASIGIFFAKEPWAWNFGSTNNVSGRKGSISKTGNNSGNLYNSIQTAMTIRLTNIPVGTIITITKVFVIAGNGQSFVPSLQDDYDNAVPRYIGRSLKDSNSPTDYKWELNPERKANQIQVTQLTQDLDGFKTTVSNTYLSKSDASGTYADKVSVASQITQSATAVTSNVQSWANNKLTAYSTTQQTTSSITNAVASKADKSQITQLSDMINLRVSKGDVTSQINLESGRVLIDSKQLLLNADTVKFTGSAFIPNAMIQSITADKITAGTLNAANVNVINLNAKSLTAGTITGSNLSMNLDTGSVQFKKGYIASNDNKIRFDLDKNYFQSLDFSNNGFVVSDGSFTFYQGFFGATETKIGGLSGDIIAEKGGIILHGVGGASLSSDTYKASVDVGSAGLGTGNGVSIMGDTRFWGGISVLGSKNAVHVTRDGLRATPAYETAESYLGDIGRSYTREDCEIWVEIDELFSDTVNTDIPYEIFLQAYDDARFWVSDFRSDKFLVKSDKPMSRFAWELKAKRRGYENERLVIQEDFDNKLLLDAQEKGVFVGGSENE